MLDFGSGFNIVYTAVAAFFAGLFLVVNILLICRKKYVRRAVDTVFYTVSCILFAAFLLAGLFGLVARLSLFGLQFGAVGTKLLITIGEKSVSLPLLGGLYAVFASPMGWALYAAATVLALLELILHPLKAKKRPKSVLSAALQNNAEHIEDVEGVKADGEAAEASGFEVEDTAETVAESTESFADTDVITDRAEPLANREEFVIDREPVAAAESDSRTTEITAENADAPIILDKKTAAEVMSEIDRLVDFAVRPEQTEPADGNARGELTDSEESPPADEAQLSEDDDTDTFDGAVESDGSAAEEEKAVSADNTGEGESDRAKTEASAERASETAGRIYPELHIKTIVRRSIVIPSPYKTAAGTETAAAKTETAGTQPAAVTVAQKKTSSGQGVQSRQQKTSAQSDDKKAAEKQTAEKTGGQGSAKGRSRKKTQSAPVPASESSARPSGPIEVEAIEIYPAEESAPAENTPAGDAKEVRPIETELPVTKRYVILNRRNVVNMFSEYLGSKDKTEQEKLTSSINTIIYK